MTAKVIPFPKPGVDKDVVSLLEHQLALAKEGKIKFVAVAIVSDRNVGVSCWAPDGDIGQDVLTAAIGSVTFLDARFKESILAGAVVSDGPDVA